MCWSIVVKEKLTVVSPFIEAFPPGRISKATKGFSVHFFIDSRNSCKLYRPIPGTFWSYLPRTFGNFPRIHRLKKKILRFAETSIYTKIIFLEEASRSALTKYTIQSLVYVSTTNIYLEYIGYMFRPVNRSSSGHQSNKSKVLLRYWHPSIYNYII